MAAEWFPKSHAEFDDLRRFVAAVIQPEAPSWYTVNQQAEYKLDQINAAMPFIARFEAAFLKSDRTTMEPSQATSLVQSWRDLVLQGRTSRRRRCSISWDSSSALMARSVSCHSVPSCGAPCRKASSRKARMALASSRSSCTSYEPS